MMEIILAKTAGYCFGVDLALNAVNSAVEKGERRPIYTLGPIIHNKQVISKLQEEGVEAIDDLDSIDEGTIIIRSHGVGEEIIKGAEKKNLNIINSTCPYVRSIQLKVKKYYEEGYQIIIVGNHKHPEVIGINGWCNNSAIIVADKNNVLNLDKYDKICLVAQTTITLKLFEEVVEKVKNQKEDALVFNTICNATKERQEETKEIAKQVDCMIIIGGYHSSNTQKLASLSREYCENTIHIETKEDLHSHMNCIKNCKKIGVSAGASTPRWIIEEVINTMANIDENKIENMQDYEGTLNDLRKGSVVEGKVISATKDEIIVNVGYKTDGIIKRSEFTRDENLDLSTVVSPQDTIEVLVLNIGSENVELSKLRLDERRAKDELEKAYNEGTILEGKITRDVKGGLMVDLGNIEVFMPASQYSYKYTKDLKSLVGKDVKGRIIEFDRKKNKIIFSQRVVLEEEYKAKKEAEAKERSDFFNSLKEGQKISGVVKSMMPYGAFIEIGPIDGFVHISDLAHTKVNHPSDVLKEGETVETVIINLDEENQKIKLSIKELTEDPWVTFIKNYKVGDKVEATIKNTVSFGAFAEIIPNVEGLIHISEISHDKVENVSSVLKTGDKVQVKIIKIDRDNKKVSLSIKATQEKPKVEIEENKTVYKEDDANPTLGDLFGDLFKK